MGLSTGDGFRFGNGTFLSRVFWRAMAINAVVALARAGYQEFAEDEYIVPQDGRNFLMETVQNFAWENPKDAVNFVVDLANAPE